MNQIQQFFDYVLNAFKFWIIVLPWQQGLRVRAGKKKKLLGRGMYFRIPYIDSVYIQEIRLRVVQTPVQTLTSKDGKTVTTSGSIGYAVTDIEKLYEKLYHPESTISNMTMSIVTKYIFSRNSTDIIPEEIEKVMISELNEMDIGVRFEYYKVANFAIARTFRLIQDYAWVNEGLDMNLKK